MLVVSLNQLSKIITYTSFFMPYTTSAWGNSEGNTHGFLTQKNDRRSLMVISSIYVKDVVTPTSKYSAQPHVVQHGLKSSSSGDYIIDPDGDGGVTPFNVYRDMRDKGGTGVTIIIHDSENRTHVGNIPGCSGVGCFSKKVNYTGVSITQLEALTQVSRICEQFIKFECNTLMMFNLFRPVMNGGSHLTEHACTTGVEQQAIPTCAHAE